ncbi:MAG: tetratricopeptide repeat protein [Chlorobi bacterium]|nr:tetratricopeptide repeat protein [Chlorobiota bacterium]
MKTVIKTSKNDSVIMLTYDRLRRITYYSDPKVSQQYTLKFLEFAKKRKDSFEIALGNFYLGNSYVVEHNYEYALKQYLKSAKYFETVKDSARLSSILNGIGAAYQNYGNDSLSLKYYKQSQQISKSRGDLRRSAFALNNIGNIYKNRGALDVAKTYMEEAVNHIETTNQLQYIIPISINLANVYTDLKDFNKSTKIYNELLPKIDTLKEVFSHGAIMRGLGNSNLVRGNNKKALHNLKRAYNIYSNSGFFDDRYDMMPDLIKAYEVNKQFASGLKLFNEYNTIKDSIFNTEKDKNLTEAIQKYETQKKDKEIIQQQLLLKKKQVQYSYMTGIAIFLLVTSILTWFILQQRQKRKNQEIIALKREHQIKTLESLIEGEEKERLRIAKELHDGVNGDLSAIKYKLTSMQEMSNKIIDEAVEMIDKSCKQVRAISHNLIPPSLESFNLVEASEEYCQNMDVTHSQQINFQYIGDDFSIPKNAEINIFRIIQELVTNSIKHAMATEINVQMSCRKNTIQLTIEDNGKGFDKSEVVTDGIGLKNVQSRIDYLQGTIDLISNKQGTSYAIEIETETLNDN